MSTDKDDELQRMAEEGRLDSTDRDLMAYQALFKILRQQPTFATSGLEEGVIKKIEQARKRKLIVDHTWLVLGVFVVVVIGVLAVAISGYRIPMSPWQRQVLALGICAGIVIVALNAVERRLLQR